MEHRRGHAAANGPEDRVGQVALPPTSVHGVAVFGVGLDAETRCAHYRTPLDVVAIRFKCCGKWFSCIECHRALANHEVVVWPVSARHRKAVLCGVCGHRLSVHEYLACQSTCPQCAAAFNPGCALHHHLYFEVRDG